MNKVTLSFVTHDLVARCRSTSIRGKRPAYLETPAELWLHRARFTQPRA